VATNPTPTFDQALELCSVDHPLRTNRNRRSTTTRRQSTGSPKRILRREVSVIETRVLGDLSIVCRPSGGLGWIAAVSLRHAIGDLLRPGVEVVIDLRRVDFIDAVGISALVGSVRRVRAVGGQAEIRGGSSQVRRRMELAGICPLLMGSAATHGNDAA
jgi:anti-anti-sigma factor